MNKLRVLHVINGLGVGGAEALLYRLATRTSEIEHEVVALAGPDWYTPMLERQGVSVHHLNIASPLSALRGMLALNRIATRRRFDVVQSWMYGSNLVAGLVVRRLGIPVVWGIHTSTFEGVNFGSRVAARVGAAFAPRLADFIINCSSRSALIHARMASPCVENAVIHNGYDPEAFFPDERFRAVTRASLNLADGAFVIGAIARWNRQKDIPNLMSAAALMQAKGLPLSWIIIGRGLDESNQELVRLIDEAGCRDNVQLLGERSDIPDIARAMDVHVLPSCGGEAFPNVIAETMLSGVPNVVTDIGDSAQIVEQTGWVIAPRDPEALSEAVAMAFAEWRDRPEQWRHRRQTARARIAKRFTFDKMAAAYEDIWTTMAAKNERKAS
jgi:glycosyltransferase involved in cell wall biosynthesis